MRVYALRRLRLHDVHLHDAHLHDAHLHGTIPHCVHHVRRRDITRRCRGCILCACHCPRRGRCILCFADFQLMYLSYLFGGEGKLLVPLKIRGVGFCSITHPAKTAYSCSQMRPRDSGAPAAMQKGCAS